MSALIRFFSFLICRLPVAGLSVVAGFLYFLIYKMVGYRKKVVRNNLELAFPEMTQSERKETERAFYRNFCRLIPEVLYIPSLNRQKLKRYVSVEDSPGSRHLAENPNRVIMLTGHFFNWEWAGLRTGLIRNTPCYAVYRPLKNKTVDRLIRKWRAHTGNVPVSARQITRRLIAEGDQLPLACFLADQSTSRGQARYYCKLFGHSVPFYTGAVKLAIKLNTPLYFGYSVPQEDGRYEIQIRLLIENPASSNLDTLMNLYVENLERVIRENPANWLWSHRRWKRRREESK